MLQRYMTAPIFEYVKERLGVGYGANGGSGFSFVMPTSPVFDLMALKVRLSEAIRNQRQAEGCIVQPNILLHGSNPTLDPMALQRANPEDIGPMSNATDVMVQDYRQQQAYTGEQWIDIQERFARITHSDTDNGPSSSERTRLMFDRPHPWENMEYIPDAFQVAHVHEPKTLVDVQNLEEQYRIGVAEALGIGSAVFDQVLGSGAGRHKSGSGSGAGGGGGKAAGPLFANIQGTRFAHNPGYGCVCVCKQKLPQV
jgi:hypothetical protein